MEVRAAALASVLLFLALQLQRISSSAAVLDFKNCGEDELSFSGSFSNELLYINGVPVGKSLFCDAVNFHSANGCLLEDYHQFCSLPQVEVHSLGERKLLLTGPKEESIKDKEGNKTLLSNKTIGIVIPGVLALCCVLICPCFYAKRKDESHTVLQKEISSVNSASELNFTPEKIPGSPLRVPPSPSRFSLSPQLTRFGSVHLNLSQILKATHNFSLNMRIGEGGFGTVYKAQLENGLVVAVKRAKKELFDSLKTEFSSEVELLSKIDHRNLVKLLGFVDQGNERLIITEYVPNGTLRTHLDGDHGKILDFNQRLEIAIDVAHGLTYLHLYAEKQIIHRDVKSSNILLTDSMRAKVADFGFARFGSMDSDKTHVSTKVKGTVGYLDPEYMRTYQLTSKSDVYSFGILLLEILTGRRPVEINRAVEERVTLRWVFTKFNEGNVTVLVDPRMEEIVDARILSRIISLAIECAAPVRASRPDMRLVGEALWAIRVDYLKTVKRGY